MALQDKVSKPTLKAHRIPLSKGVTRIVQPLRFDPFGRLGYAILLTISMLFVALFLLMMFDYYWQCQMLGIDALCFYGSYPIFGGYD